MRTFFLLSVFLPVAVFAQVSDDFSDGDFTQDPAWSGDASHFKISSSSAIPEAQRPALQLNAPGAGISALTVAQHFAGDLEWVFWAKLSLNTSSGNFARVYLLSDKNELKNPLNGYFLQIGGAEDSVIFFRQDSLDAVRLLRLNTAYTGNSTNAMRFKVLRSKEGTWKFFADTLGGNSPGFQGETADLVFPEGGFFGLSCQYTSSNTTKFYFDDLYAGPLIIDSIPPALLKADVVNPSEILLTFSEAVSLESAEEPSHYELIPGPGHPYAAVRLLDPASVHLFFDLEMQNGVSCTLNVSSVEDLAGNAMDLATLPVLYYSIMPYDLVFTEIMADPTPPKDLAEYEYLEIFNRSPFPIDLGNLDLAISSTVHELPSFIFDPGSYLLICDEDAAFIMGHYGRAISLPSFNLPNTGTQLHLADTSGKTVCFLQYDVSWYKDETKADGGWSLEMIDPTNPCKNEENWMASVHIAGGTPGTVNSVPASLDHGMKITYTCCLNEYEIEVGFSESLDSLIAADTNRYSAGPLHWRPDLAIPVSPGFSAVKLHFSQGLTTGQVYELTVNPGLKNCIGEELQLSLQSKFAIPQPVEPFDIIINEVLFNPVGDGVDFIEIYNRSSKAINLEDLVLASVKHSPPDLPDTQSVAITTSCQAILPSGYLVLTSDPQKIKNQYYAADPEAFIEMASFPSYNNDMGQVLLTDQAKTVIDGMKYSEEMHFLMLNSTEGISLERICQERLGDDASNWHSAAGTAGFATPGYRNSQYLEITEVDAFLSLQPEVFSPDGDGRDDNLGIAYQFDSPGKLITVLIFNAEGRLVRTLVNNELPGTHGAFSWDGTLDDRTPARDGIYIIYAETLDMEGNTRHYKKAGVLARNR